MYPIIYGRIHYRRTWSIKIKSSVKTGLFALIIDERKSAMKVGVDLGGSHIGMGIIDDNGRILEKKKLNYIIFKICKNLLLIQYQMKLIIT